MPKIAVINNDTDFLTLMNELLTARGWETVICREGHNAFSIIKQEEPVMVILDIRMETPEMGWNVLELMKLDPATRHIPVVVCSAAVIDLKAKQDWLSEHGIDILLKPFDIDDLYATVERTLAR